jgi:TPP-dependent pyruvate/acetoin dehydrogenase alpha subunit
MYSREFIERLYCTLYIIRVFETECIKLYRQGLLIGYFHPHLGKDAIVPFNVHLERALVPQENDIMEVVRKVLHL